MNRNPEGVEHRLRAFWEACKAGPRPGLSPEAVAAIESQLSCVLPPIVESLYRIADGIDESGEGGDLFTVWPLREWRGVIDVAAEWRGSPDYGPLATGLPDAGDYFTFADCMLHSELFAVRVRPAGTPTQVIWLCGSHYAVVAPTFEQFWELYLVDRDSVLHPPDELVRRAAG